VKKKMTCSQFISNNRGIDEGRDLPAEYLTAIFNAIEAREIQMLPARA
jgi:Sec7-like guanine-nucleotide exchange factor